MEISMRANKDDVRIDARKFQDKLVTILVSKFSNVFTVPDGVLFEQDAEPAADPLTGEEEGDPFMYFIRTGQYQVSIKSNFNTSKNSQPTIEVKYLFDGDHFGEIGLIYSTKRTATVKSQNYGSLAKLNKPDWAEV